MTKKVPNVDVGDFLSQIFHWKTHPISETLGNHTFHAALQELENRHITKIGTGKWTIYEFILAFDKFLYNLLGDPSDDGGIGLLGKAKDVLRGITYFSWESREQIFQIRRTFPVDNDLSSYSVCYPEWGAVGETMEKLRKGRAADKLYPVYRFGMMLRSYQQRALPYLQEIKKRKFNQIISLPVLQESTLEQWLEKTGPWWFGSELHGIFLVFLNQHSRLTTSVTSDPTFREAMKAFTLAASRVLRAQQQMLLKKSGGALDVMWKKRARQADNITVLKITIEEKKVSKVLRLDTLNAFVVQSLRGRYFAIEASKSPTRVQLLVAPSQQLVAECHANNHQLVRRLHSDIDRGLHSIGAIHQDVTYRIVARHFNIQVLESKR